LPTIIFRYFNVYGERQPTKGQYAPAVGLFLRQHANGESITITGDGNQRRDFVHVSDVVSANILAATTSTDVKNFGQVFNVGTGLNHSVNEIVSMISNNFVFIDARLGEARETLSNAQKIKNAFGWYATVSIASWIKRQSLSQGRG
jgi:UDP-glucose 4-epimerase